MGDAADFTGARRFELDFDPFFLPWSKLADVPLNVSASGRVGGFGRGSQEFSSGWDAIKNPHVFGCCAADIFDDQLKIGWLINLDFTGREFLDRQCRSLNTFELSISRRCLG